MYNWDIENGIAKELRSCSSSRRTYKNSCNDEWYITFMGTLHVELSENGTQKEHMQVAKLCAKEIENLPIDGKSECI